MSVALKLFRFLLIFLVVLGLVACGGSSGGGGGDAEDNAAPVPDAPSNLNAIVTSSGSIDLTWQDNADNEDAYIVERSETSSTNGFSIVATLSADSAFYSNTGLTPATTYYYRVAASNSEGQSDYTAVASAITDVAPTSAPLAPSGLNGSAASSTSVSLFWIDNSDNESQFDVYRATSLGGPFTLAKTVSVNVTSTSIDGLNPATYYVFKVVAVNAVGSSPDSNTHEITTPAASENPPPAPSGLSVGNATESTLTLSWTDNSDNETGFNIYRSSSESGTYSQIATTTASSYSNSGLSPSTSYWYKVSAYNGAGESTMTAAASGTTLAPPLTVPTAPSGLSVNSATESTLTLNWTDNSDNESGFNIYRSSSEYGTYSQIATATASNYTNSGLSSSTCYWFKVSAYNGAGESTMTAAVSGTTLAPPVTIPAAPTNPTVSNVTTSSATLSWTDNSDDESGFQIGSCTGLVSSSGSLISCASGFNQIAQVGANVTAYNMNGLNASTQYSLFVRAYNSAGTSSNTGVSFTTDTGQQSATLQAIASNVVMHNSLDSTWANTAYPNSYPVVGINWYSTLTGYPNTLAFASVVKFDLSALQGKTVDSATLNLESNSAPVGYYPQDFKIAAVANSWSASTLTWNVMESFYYYTNSWQTLNYPAYSGQIYNIDLTATVQNWVSGNYYNYGLGILSADYLYNPGNIDSLDAYDFYTPTLSVMYH